MMLLEEVFKQIAYQLDIAMPDRVVERCVQLIASLIKAEPVADQVMQDALACGELKVVVAWRIVQLVELNVLSLELVIKQWRQLKFIVCWLL